MVWINYEHFNYKAPKGRFGGAICMCAQCKTRQDERIRPMNIDQAVNRACKKPTLLDALSWICVWESERAIRQARENRGSGTNGAGWDTCFKHCLKRVMVSYNKPKEKRQKLEMDGLDSHRSA